MFVSVAGAVFFFPAKTGRGAATHRQNKTPARAAVHRMSPRLERVVISLFRLAPGAAGVAWSAAAKSEAAESVPEAVRLAAVRVSLVRAEARPAALAPACSNGTSCRTPCRWLDPSPAFPAWLPSAADGRSGS